MPIREWGFIVEDVCDNRNSVFKAYPRSATSKIRVTEIVVFDENMMSQIMNGFPNLHMVSGDAAIVYSAID